MNAIEAMFRTHPAGDEQRAGDYAEVIRQLLDCAAVCTACADACLAEAEPQKLRKCIRLDLDCADTCAATARLLGRQTETPNELVHAQLHACVVACQLCADECRGHARMHEHCDVCAQTCRHCQERCNHLLGEITSSGVEESSLR